MFLHHPPEQTPLVLCGKNGMSMSRMNRPKLNTGMKGKSSHVGRRLRIFKPQWILDSSYVRGAEPGSTSAWMWRGWLIRSPWLKEASKTMNFYQPGLARSPHNASFGYFCPNLQGKTLSVCVWGGGVEKGEAFTKLTLKHSYKKHRGWKLYSYFRFTHSLSQTLYK